MKLSRRFDPVVQSVTSAPESLEAEQRERIKRYLVTMGIRTACFAGAFVFQGWLRWTCVALAVVLPFFAVVLANATRPRALGQVGPVVPRADDVHHLER